jgi:hypothetical protein
MENPGCEDVPGHQVVAACMIVANNSSIKKAINLKQTERTTMFPERYWFFLFRFQIHRGNIQDTDYRSIEKGA